MNVVIKNFDELTNKELYEILRFRSEVFILEQNVAYQDVDRKDYKSHHIFLQEEDGQIISYVRAIPHKISYDDCSIGRVIVRKEKRRQGLSTKTMKVAIDFIKNNYNADKIRISAQLYLKEFYSSLGFVAVSDVYLEDTLEHIEMLLTF